jgi:hypothetical protein
VNADSRALERSENPVAVPGLLSKAFSFPVMLAGLLTTLAVLTVRERFDDPDMWWHLKLGETTWTTHHVPTTDLFSYTTNHHSYIPHEWLSQLLLYAAYHFGGYTGMMLWLCFFTAAVLVGGYALCSLYSGNAKVSLLGALIIFLFGTVGFSIRPQMIGYLLLMVELALLHLGKTKSSRWFWGLPPLFALWVNCHGSFSLGIGVAAVYLFSSYCHFEAGLLTAPKWSDGRRTTLAITLGLSVLALFLNPVGSKLVFYPLNTMFVPSIGVNAVSEWLPLQLGDIRGLGFLAVIGAILMLVIVRRKELFWHEFLLMAVGIWLASSHARLIFAFGILVAPTLCRLLADTWDGYSTEQDHPLVNAALILLSLLTWYIAFPNREDLTAQVREHSPMKAVEFIKAHQLSGPMLNDWVSGGYLVWALPEHPDFIDGRGDIFEWAGVLGEFGKWATLESPPNDLLDKYRISFCLLTREAPMARIMPLLPNWKTVYKDENSVIFVRTSGGTPTS